MYTICIYFINVYIVYKCHNSDRLFILYLTLCIILYLCMYVSLWREKTIESSIVRLTYRCEYNHCTLLYCTLQYMLRIMS